MNKINIRCEVREYPDKIEEYHTMIVRNHWNDNGKVLIELAGREYTFRSYDIINAIDACKKAH